MKLDDIRRRAYAESKVGWEDMTPTDKLLWYELREIYRKFKDGISTSDQCKTMVSSLVNDWNASNVSEQNGISAMKRIADLYRDMELIGSEFRKDPNIDTAWKLINKIDNIEMERKQDV